MARADTYTHLGLNRFATSSFVGLVPPWFHGVSYELAGQWATCGKCATYFSQYEWQNERYMSRESLAATLRESEMVIEDYLGVPLCPTPHEQIFPYTEYRCHPSRRHYGGQRLNASNETLELEKCPAFFWGEKVNTLLGEYDVTFEMASGAPFCDVSSGGKLADGQTFYDPETRQPITVPVDFPKRAVITVPLTDYAPGEIKAHDLALYLPEQVAPDAIEAEPSYRLQCDGASSAVINYEIDETYRIGIGQKNIRIVPNEPRGNRPLPYPEYEAGIDVAVFAIPPWLLIDIRLYEEWPTGCNGQCPIDGTKMENYLFSVRVVRTWYDQSAPMVEFLWEPGQNNGCGCGRINCDICNVRKRPGCLVGDIRPGCDSVVVQPACYEAARGWCRATFGECGCDGWGAPDWVKVKYWHGYVADRCHTRSGKLRANPADLTCPSMEWAITALAVSRMPKPICSCQCPGTGNAAHKWPGANNQEMLETSENSSFFMPEEMAMNRIGTSQLEVAVWKRLDLIRERMCQHTKQAQTSFI